MSTGAATVRGWGRDVAVFARDWPADGARVLAREVADRLARDTGGDGRLSHGRRLGAATVDVDTGAGRADVSSGGSSAVWSILEHGTRAHVTRARPGRVLATPYGPRRSVSVRGTPPAHTWTRGSERGMDAAERAAAAAWGQVG